MRLNKELGYYLPSFFFLKIDTPKEIPSLLESDIERTLTHELIHFLQDICTTYGLVNICNTVDIIKDQNRILLKEKSLEIPVSASMYSETTMKNKDLFSIYIGDDGKKYCKFPKNIKITNIDIEPIEINKINFNINCITITLSLSSKPENNKSFHFGAMSLIESMAHLIEKEIYGEEDSSISFPYDIAKLVTEKIYPELSHNNLAIAELCEASLMTYHPADAFIKSLESMKKNNFSYKKINDAYEFVLNYNKLDTSDGTSYSITGEYKNIINLAISQLESLFTAKPLSEDTWARDIINCAYRYKKNKSSLVSAIFSSDKNLSPRDSFYNLINTVGFPIACNAKGQYWQQSTKIYYTDVLYMVISTFNDLMSHGRTECKLLSYCKDASLPIDKLCTTEPWRKDHMLNRECRFSGMWRMWGLEGVQLKI